MNSYTQRVNETVEGLREDLFASLGELVKIPSMNHPPTGDEYECQMAVARRWREMGIEPKIYSLDSVPGLKEHQIGRAHV